MQEKKFSYIKFEEKELQTFLDIMDVEKQGTISLGDIEVTCKQLGLEDSYKNIKALFKDMVHMKEGGLNVDELSEFLMNSERTYEEEFSDIFNYIDYDHKGEINKNKLKIIIDELTQEKITDNEAEDMINLMKNDKGFVDKESFKDRCLKFDV